MTDLKIQDINPDDYEDFSWAGKTFLAKASDVYDGDTFTSTWIWNGQVIKQRCRCVGYNSHEIRPRRNTRNREAVIEMAYRARDRFTELLNQDDLIIVDCFQNDNFGRMLVVVYNVSNGEKSLNQIMLEEGHGLPYEGKRKCDPKLGDSCMTEEKIKSCSVLTEHVKNKRDSNCCIM